MRMVVARGGVGLRVRLVGTLLAVGILVGAVACGSAPTARPAAGSSRAATPALPVVTSAAITHASATFSTSATPAASSHSTPTPAPVSGTGGTNVTAASCTVHLDEGKVDDSVDADLTCTVRHAPNGDTSFALRFGIVDPVGRLHTFPQTCDGRLTNGAGTCDQTYTFIVPFHAVPGPISGEALPSHHPIAGPSPTSTPGA
ncbi:MAG TPA: hypothetical protein VLJ14_04665 [Ktedonobacterales bacterium]|nr:hypothetical protein [Ktedonobacterales bacterium]